MARRKSQSAVPDGQHIFHNTELTELALRWKHLTATHRHKEAMRVLERIVIGSTPMFERLAQYERYHYTVELPALVSAAQEKIVKWLLRWELEKGPLFTWFSKCAKNAFRSEVSKVNQFRNRFHTTSDNLEKFYPSEDHSSEKRAAAEDARLKLDELTCRWGDPQEIGTIKFLIDCIIDENHNKHNAIRAASFSWGVGPDMAKFFYSWALVAVRDQMCRRAYVPFTEQDLFRLRHSYEHIVNLLDMPNTPFNWEHVRWLIATHGGLRLRIPTLASLAKAKEDHQIYRDIDDSDKDPETVAKIAKRHNRTAKTAQEAYEEQTEILNPKRSGEHEIYEPEHSPFSEY